MAPPRLLRNVACSLLALAGAPVSASEPPSSRFDCQVTGTESLAGLGNDGRPAQFMRFICRVRGGPLDGFEATGTKIWDGEQQHGVLLGSLVVARKDTAVVVYEVTQVTRQARPRDADARGWEGRGAGIYRLATGPASALAGRTFRSVSRSAGPGAFTIETIVEND